MKTVWIKGLDPDQTKDIRADFISAQLLRKRLTEILEEKINSKRTLIRNSENYEKANWPYLVSDSIGYERALAEVISLLENKEN